MNLKKGLIFITLCAVLSVAAFAQENSSGNNSGHTKAEISYQNAPIYKILDSKDTYVVLYGMYGANVGTVSIPKKWAKWNNNEPRKLTLRKVPSKIEPYITVVKKNGDFLKVILTIPMEKNNRVWGIASASKVDNSEPSSIELKLR